MAPGGSWGSLPAELRLAILSFLPPGGRASYASVCWEWRLAIEKVNFRSLTLTQSCLDEFAELCRPRLRRAIKHICLRIQLPAYGCRECYLREDQRQHLRNNTIITTAIWNLFYILGTWERTDADDLTLEIDVFSPSDNKHWHRNLIFGDRENPNLTRTSRSHKWYRGASIRPPHPSSIPRLFEYIELDHQEGGKGVELASNEVVTRFLIRRQTRRRFTPRSLAKLAGKCTKLEKIHYEYWRGLRRPEQEKLDQELEEMILSPLPCGIRDIALFEDFNDVYALSVHGFMLGAADPDFKRATAGRKVAAAFAQAATKLETLSVSFNIDAELFFQEAVAHESWSWDRLETLVLTSPLLGLRERREPQDTSALTEMLYNASAACLRMPNLRLLEIWHGSRVDACLFRYQKGPSSCSIAVKGTWLPKIEDTALQAWQNVALAQTDKELEFCRESLLPGNLINSHGAAADQLGLSALVAHPTSLRQIQREHETVVVPGIPGADYS